MISQSKYTPNSFSMPTKSRSVKLVIGVTLGEITASLVSDKSLTSEQLAFAYGAVDQCYVYLDDCGRCDLWIKQTAFALKDAKLAEEVAKQFGLRITGDLTRKALPASVQMEQPA